VTHNSDAYRRELDAVLPAGLPNRAAVVAGEAEHLARMADVNRYINLTRIVDPAEAAVKHVLDSVMPWQRVQPHGSVLDLGSGAGFPGIPLALAMPEKQFILVESIGKKARFISEVAAALSLRNVDVRAERGEQVLRRAKPDLVIARAVGSIAKLLDLLSAPRTPHLLLYKGPEVEAELQEARVLLLRRKLRAEIALSYELPGGRGARTIVEVA
jgi:16S rRNA (guanine527-N7)-methyltransferase